MSFFTRLMEYFEIDCYIRLPFLGHCCLEDHRHVSTQQIERLDLTSAMFGGGFGVLFHVFEFSSYHLNVLSINAFMDYDVSSHVADASATSSCFTLSLGFRK